MIKKTKNAKDKIILALDTDDLKEAEDLVKELKDYVGYFKDGMADGIGKLVTGNSEFFGEYEVLCSKLSRYKMIREEEKGGFHIFYVECVEP